jgi:hypothetical protein
VCGSEELPIDPFRWPLHSQRIIRSSRMIASDDLPTGRQYFWNIASENLKHRVHFIYASLNSKSVCYNQQRKILLFFDISYSKISKLHATDSSQFFCLKLIWAFIKSLKCCLRRVKQGHELINVFTIAFDSHSFNMFDDCS